MDQELRYHTLHWQSQSMLYMRQQGLGELRPHSSIPLFAFQAGGLLAMYGRTLVAKHMRRACCRVVVEEGALAQQIVRVLGKASIRSQQSVLGKASIRSDARLLA